MVGGGEVEARGEKEEIQFLERNTRQKMRRVRVMVQNG